ncbi:MAG: Rieske 2Fe-2S domain-containing protein [Candidatus Binatia bacterium]
MKVTLCKLSDISAQGTKTVDFFGREVLLMNVGGSSRAVMNICMHLGGPMKRQGDKLVCEWHGAEFQCGDGKCLKGPARPDARLILLPIRVEEDVVSYVYGEWVLATRLRR